MAVELRGAAEMRLSWLLLVVLVFENKGRSFVDVMLKRSPGWCGCFNLFEQTTRDIVICQPSGLPFLAYGDASQDGFPVANTLGGGDGEDRDDVRSYSWLMLLVLNAEPP